MPYDLILKNVNIKSYRRISLIFAILNVLYFIFLLADERRRYIAIISLCTLSAYFLYKLLIAIKRSSKFYVDEWVYFLLMLLWIDSYPLAILNLFLMLISTAATQELHYKFSDIIVQKNFPWKQFEWVKFSNVIIKDNILTMDFITDKLIQGEIQNEVNEKEFNAFASKNLSIGNNNH